MKVKELIEKLKKCNPEAELTVGDNYYFRKVTKIFKDKYNINKIEI